jgi:hypothetical protein
VHVHFWVECRVELNSFWDRRSAGAAAGCRGCAVKSSDVFSRKYFCEDLVLKPSVLLGRHVRYVTWRAAQHCATDQPGCGRDCAIAGPGDTEVFPGDAL